MASKILPSQAQHRIPRWSTYRPYLDFGPAVSNAPFHVVGLDWAIDDAINGTNHPEIQASVNESFRDELTISPLTAYSVDHPKDVPRDLISNRGRAFIDVLESHGRDIYPDGLRACWALSKMGYHHLVLEIVPDDVSRDLSSASSSVDIEFAYLRTWAMFRCWLDDPRIPYRVQSFEDIALHAPVSRPKLHAAYQVVMQTAKFSGDRAKCGEWQERHAKILSDISLDLEPPEIARLTSRFHRVGGFLPQMDADADGVEREMTLAERAIRDAPAPDEFEETARLEMLFPCIESRMRESLWRGDLDSATSRAEEYINIRPTDPKGWSYRADILVEQAHFNAAAANFAMAAALAPPGRSIALYMRAQCLQQVGDDEGALLSLLDCIEADPLAIGAVAATADLSTRMGRKEISTWCSTRLEELVAMSREDHIPSIPEPYQKY